MNSTREQVIREFTRDEICERHKGWNSSTEYFRIHGTEQDFYAICKRYSIEGSIHRVGKVLFARGDGFAIRHYLDGDFISMNAYYA